MLKFHFKKCIFFLLTFSVINTILAKEPLTPIFIDTAPKIDGNLDDAIWQTAPYITGYKTFYPDFGKVIDEETFTYMVYDNENLYFAFRCHETQPDKIKTSITSRDKIYDDDWVCINLDTFNDQQTLYAFYINPNGIQGDSRFITGQEDRNIDLVWYSAGMVYHNGYSVEICIPLKSIRFSNSNPVEMAVIFERYISRRSEHSSYPGISPEVGISGFITQMMPMIYYNLQQNTLFELLPAITYSQKHGLNDGRLAVDERRGEFSLTTKYGITSDLVLDGTYNPDFSQIEADAGQVDINLRHDLYYDEKRPFFLEGKENFRIAATSASELDPVRTIIHTRKIIDPLVGIKLTGKIGSKNTLAILYAMDEYPDSEQDSLGAYTHFPIIRYKRALNKDSYFGGIITSKESDKSYNRLFGMDGLVRVDRSSTLEYHGLLSQVKNEASSYSKESSIGLRYSYETRNIDYDLSIVDVSRNFNAEMGYIQRTGIFQMTGLLRPKFYPQSNFCHRIDPELYTTYTRDKFYSLWETFNHFSLLFYLGGSSQFKVKYSYATEIYQGERFKTGGFHIFAGGQFTKQFYFGLLYRRIKAIYYSTNPYQGHSNRVTVNLIYQPSSKVNTEFDLIYYDFYRDSDNHQIYDYPIIHGKLTYQLNKYLFLRGIIEYNDYKKEMLTDLLISFTYIPGTVIHFGYGSLYDKIAWRDNEYIDSHRFMEKKRGLFFKTSYLWRK